MVRLIFLLVAFPALCFAVPPKGFVRLDRTTLIAKKCSCGVQQPMKGYYVGKEYALVGGLNCAFNGLTYTIVSPGVPFHFIVGTQCARKFVYTPSGKVVLDKIPPVLPTPSVQK